MSEIPLSNQRENKFKELRTTELALAVTALSEILPEYSMLLEESINRLNQLQNLNRLLGKLAPGGTAPRAGLEQLWEQSADNADESPILLELRAMLEDHWGQWTPALREAEGLPPAQQDD